MQNKKKTYLLLAIVLLVWGLVIYQFFSYTGEAPVEMDAGNIQIIAPVKIKPRDTVVLNLNYRDPFLGKIYAAQSKKNRPVATSRLRPTIKEEWPQVIYKGLVTDSKAKNKIFLLLINGNTYMMKAKQTEESVTVLNGDRKSVNIKFKGENITVNILE